MKIKCPNCGQDNNIVGFYYLTKKREDGSIPADGLRANTNTNIIQCVYCDKYYNAQTEVEKSLIESNK
jgi:hypothetical protein